MKNFIIAFIATALFLLTTIAHPEPSRAQTKKLANNAKSESTSGRTILSSCTCSCGKECNGSCIGSYTGCTPSEGLACLADCCESAPNQQDCGGEFGPATLRAIKGRHPGEVDLIWAPVTGAEKYVIERSVRSTPATWVRATVSTKTAATIPGLKSGTAYSFRVAAVMSTGQSDWSNTVTEAAP
jgi:hypothetical protein